MLQMATKPRHNQLACGFFAGLIHKIKARKLYALQEQCYLAYMGEKYSGNERLIDIRHEFQPDIDTFLETCGVIQPDFLYFSTNTYIQNSTTMITAGIPNLVIEIWSRNNQHDKDFKFTIYSSSPQCEHWYLTLDSNEVQCWKGKEQLRAQSLTRVLKTTEKIRIDLRYLSLQ